jgi:fructosamine-3-kinase
MHQRTSDKFGWKRDNTIGSTAQINTPTYDWVQFWREYRLGYQLKLAQANGHTGKLLVSGDKLLAALDSFSLGEAPRLRSCMAISSGNYGFCRDGRPVVFDPPYIMVIGKRILPRPGFFSGFPASFMQRIARPIRSTLAITSVKLYTTSITFSTI